jgi:hypothetical protein
MRIPIEFRLILLLVLAWRLIIAAKRRYDFGHRKYEDLSKIAHSKVLKPSIKSNLCNTYQEFYRKEVRNRENENQTFFMLFLAQKLEKTYRKGGLFRFFWFNQPLVVSFYQSLICLNLKPEAEIFEKILIKISSDGLNKIKSSEIEKLKPDTFSVHGDEYFPEFEAFDKMFLLEKYLQAIHENL